MRAVTPALGGTYRCYGSHSSSPYLLSQSSDTPGRCSFSWEASDPILCELKDSLRALPRTALGGMGVRGPREGRPVGLTPQRGGANGVLQPVHPPTTGIRKVQVRTGGSWGGQAGPSGGPSPPPSGPRSTAGGPEDQPLTPMDPGPQS
ncbi:Hypothetical predicted protein, partial [Marmota monax]